MTAPPFPYFGGKQTLAARIADLLGPHDHYVEPFAGSLAVLLSKSRSTVETVNDLNGELMAFWRVLRDRPEDLARVCALTPHSRAEYELSMRRPEDLDELERARRIWVKLTQGRSGLFRRTGWRHYVETNGHVGMANYLSTYVSRLLPAASRLAGVSLECRPALELIDKYGRYESVLLYIDPPYLGTVRTWGKSYTHELRSEAGHTELADALLACKATVVLSGYHSPLYDELYDGWRRTELRAFAGNAVEGRRTEVLWSNRPLGEPTLWDGASA